MARPDRPRYASERGAAPAGGLAGARRESQGNAARRRRVEGGADAADAAGCAEAVLRLLERIGPNAEARRDADRLQRQAAWPARPTIRRWRATAPRPASRAKAIESDPARSAVMISADTMRAGADLPTVAGESLLVANVKLVAAVELVPASRADDRASFSFRLKSADAPALTSESSNDSSTKPLSAISRLTNGSSGAAAISVLAAQRPVLQHRGRREDHRRRPGPARPARKPASRRMSRSKARTA